MKYIFFTTIILISSTVTAQISINSDNSLPDNSSMLDIQSSTKGLLIPRMDSTNRKNIIDPAAGLMVFDTTTMSFWYYVDSWKEGLGIDDKDWVRTKEMIYNLGDSIYIGRSIDNPQNVKTDFHIDESKNVLFGKDLTGSGFKAIFYAQKGAFRCGYLNNPFGGINYDKFWDYDSVGYYSFAGGRNSRAKGFGAFAFGSFGWADGSSSVAFFGQAKGNNSYTFGGNSKGSGSFTVEGTAEEDGGIAMYGYTGGRYGVSIGGGTTGLGASSSRQDYAVAIGWNSDARGQASIALGPSDAYGYNSFSTGWVTEARGNYSSTFGYQTIAYPYASMALGKFNTVVGDSASWVSTDPIFIIGDGLTNTTRSNSFMIQKNGQTSIGYDSPTGMLNISTELGSINNGGALETSNASLLIGTSTSGMAFDANQIETVGSTLNFNFSSSENVTLVNGGGKVGINTSSPEHSVHINNPGTVSSPTIDLVLASATSKRPTILFSENSSSLDLNDGMSLEYDGAVSGNKFYINGIGGTPRLIVENSGDVGIGTTNPTELLEVSEAGNARIRVTSTNNSSAGIELVRSSTSNTDWRIENSGNLKFFSSLNINGGATEEYSFGTGIFRPALDNNKQLGASGNRWTKVYAVNGTIQTSDRRFKKNIVPLTYGLDEIRSLEPVSYQWKDGADNKQHIGLIAQDVQKIIPEAVEDENPEILGMNYSELVPVLIQAIKDQQDLIKKNINDIEHLKKEIEALKKISNTNEITTQSSVPNVKQ
ncbi:MAG: hypothetical protein HKN68_05825 [Saprospiraceae bacterium]|nr:hypothetical protein [Saprospiraceae bacterium]